MNVQEQITTLLEQMKAQNHAFNELKIHVAEFQKSSKQLMETMIQTQQETLERIQPLVEKHKVLNENYEQEIHDFKLLKTQVSKQLLEKGSVELNQEMQRVRADVSQYNELKREMSLISQKVAGLGEEINKFLTISKSIKEKDFELTQYAKEIFKADKEKVELLKKIDSMERLVARSRQH